MDAVPVTRRHWRSFLVNLSLVVLLAVSGLYTGLALSSGRTIEAEITTRARTIFGTLVLARGWNALHGGVFVEKRAGVNSSPYLENPDREGIDGTVYTMRTPELMTREMSELTGGDGAFSFHLTSLNPLNPANTPDAFEAAALARIERGEGEVAVRETRGERIMFRYLGPLRVEQACLECHAGQGYRVGQVRGGISVTFDVTGAERDVRQARWVAIGLFVFTTAALLLVLGGLVASLHRRLNVAEARVVAMAITDDLTGLHNRRYTEQRLKEELVRSQRHDRRCACIMIDIDLFKQTNDTHGHAGGDAVLRGLAVAARSALRESDVLGRWGGEEFLAVLPETDLAGARTMAERLRQAIEAMRVDFEGVQLSVTVSLGVADAIPGRDPEARDAEQLVARADEALYRAKAAGRNRIEVASPGPGRT
jgi:diguanylate cyclase (GGDEF)-like protein